MSNGENMEVEVENPSPILTEDQQLLLAVTKVYTNENLSDNEKVQLTDFEVERLLGFGGYGKVFLVRRKNQHDKDKLYAMKVINKKSTVFFTELAEHTKAERLILEAIGKSPYLVSLNYAFQTNCNLYLVLDYVCGGELYIHLNRETKFNEDVVRIYMAELTVALQFLHKLGIVYRDLKLENILLDNDGHIKIVDFGLSKILTAEEHYRAFSYCGTADYMAPELFLPSVNGYNMSVDIWAMGVLMYELLTSNTPFNGCTFNDIKLSVLHNEPAYPENLSAEAIDLMKFMLTKDPVQRLSINEVKMQAFFANINWQDIQAKRHSALYMPKVDHDLNEELEFGESLISNEVSYDTVYTKTLVECLYRGYTYVAPDHLNAIRKAKGYHIEFCNNVEHYLNVSPMPFELGEKIACGSFGTCHFYKDKTMLAKVIPIQKYRPSELDALISCASDKNSNRRIVKFLKAFHYNLNIVLIFERVPGKELREYIYETGGINESRCRLIARQLVEALKFIHSKGFIHGDIKPENIIFTNNKFRNVRIIDFGAASYFKNKQQWRDLPRYTLHYAPPEALVDPFVCNYSKSFDIYGLGSTIYTMLVGQPPYQMNGEDFVNNDVLQDRIINKKFNRLASKWINTSSDFRILIAQCLHKNYKCRPKLEKIEKSSWLNRGQKAKPSVVKHRAKMQKNVLNMTMTNARFISNSKSEIKSRRKIEKKIKK